MCRVKRTIIVTSDWPQNVKEVIRLCSKSTRNEICEDTVIEVTREHHAMGLQNEPRPSNDTFVNSRHRWRTTAFLPRPSDLKLDAPEPSPKIIAKSNYQSQPGLGHIRYQQELEVNSSKPRITQAITQDTYKTRNEDKNLDELYSSYSGSDIPSPREVGAFVIVRIFREDGGMLPLYNKAAVNSAKWKTLDFRPHSQLLDLLCIGSSRKTSDTTQNITLSLLKSSMVRARIADYIFGIPDFYPDRKIERIYLQPKVDNEHDEDGDSADLLYIESLIRHDIMAGHVYLSALKDTTMLLVKSLAFQIYKNNFQREIQRLPLAPVSFETDLIVGRKQQARALLVKEPEAVTQTGFQYEWIAEELLSGRNLDLILDSAISRQKKAAVQAQFPSAVAGTSTGSDQQPLLQNKTVPDYAQESSVSEDRPEHPVSNFLRILASAYEDDKMKVAASAARVLARKLRNTNSDRIIIRTEQGVTPWEKVQTRVEKIIGLPIDWWPLNAPHQCSIKDLSHVEWRCNCGEQQSMEVPVNVAQRLEDFLSRRASSLTHAVLYGLTVLAPTMLLPQLILQPTAYKAQIREALDFPQNRAQMNRQKLASLQFEKLSTKILAGTELILTEILESAGVTFWFDVPAWSMLPTPCDNQDLARTWPTHIPAASLPSRTHANAASASGSTRSTSIQTVLAAPSQGVVPPQGTSSNPTSGGHSPANSLQNQHTQSGIRPHSPPNDGRHIFLTSKTGGHHLLAQWDTSRPSQNDKQFFLELRNRYISMRGFWRYYLGFKRFSHCDFHRLKKVGRSTYALEAKELPGERKPERPEHKAYHYYPKPANPNPPIDAQEFYIHFHACHHRRKAQTFWFHRCRHTPTSSNEAVQSIPRRNTALDVNTDQYEIFWGLCVKEKYSILAIVLYNLLAMTPSLAFLLWWVLGSEEKDLSNGSVPAALTLAGLSLFWAIIVSMKQQEF